MLLADGEHRGTPHARRMTVSVRGRSPSSPHRAAQEALDAGDGLVPRHLSISEKVEDPPCLGEVCHAPLGREQLHLLLVTYRLAWFDDVQALGGQAKVA